MVRRPGSVCSVLQLEMVCCAMDRSPRRPPPCNRSFSPGALRALACALALCTAPLPAIAGPPRSMNPAQADAHRAEVRAKADEFAQAGDPRAAGIELDRGASEIGDPLLFLDAADAYLEQARTQRDIATAQAAIERAHIAFDILYFLRDAEQDKPVRPVEGDVIRFAIGRAQTVIDEAQALVEEIEAARAEPEPTVAAAPPEDDAPAKPGRGKVITGSLLTVAGLGMVGMGVAGLVLGDQKQLKAEDPAVYGDEYDDVEASGRTANILAGVGFGVGAVALITGVTLIGRGRRDAKRVRSNDDTMVGVSPIFDFAGGGISVHGRF